MVGVEEEGEGEEAITEKKTSVIDLRKYFLQ